ncbi:MAG TPA: choice-of-anchor D domain-containing protein, partial [Actinomycetota bacterium]|nr:choice-of-anchor D domain-containing protein [Actinomycetota bacterium]
MAWTRKRSWGGRTPRRGQHRSALVVLLGLVLGILPSWTTARADAVTPVSAAAFDSQAGDWIGAGRQISFSAVSYDGLRNGYPTFSVSNASGDSFQVWFAGIAGSGPLTPGIYEDAQRFDFRAPGTPGLDVFGDGRGCNVVAGRFVVYEATYTPSGDVATFSAAFEDHCEGGVPALFGALAYQSSNFRTRSYTRALNLVSPDGLAVSQQFTITNNGPAPLNPYGFSIAGGNAMDFSLVANTCLGTLVAGQSCAVTVVYTPGVGYSSAATLYFGDEDAPLGSPGDPAGAGQGMSVPLTGTTDASPPSGQGNGPPASYAFFDSEPGDWVGGGAQYSFPSVGFNFDDGDLEFTLTNSSNDLFYVMLGAASGPLVPGVYEEAQRDVFRPPGHPGLDVYGDGRGCNTVAGRFVVDDATYDPNSGALESFAARFEEHCEGGPSALFGVLVYHSSAPYRTATVAPASLGITSANGDRTTANLTITNQGPATLAPYGFTISGPNAADFSVANTTCGVVLAGSSCQVTVAYTPGESSVSQATLSFFDEDAPQGSPGETAGAGQGRQ